MLSNPSGGFHPGISSLLDRGKVPLLQGTSEGLKAIKHLFSYAAFSSKKELEKEEQEKADKTEQDRPTTAVPQAVTQVDKYMRPGQPVLSEYTSKKILTAYGIPCVREGQGS